MDPERQREIARKGGAFVPAGKRSFSTDRVLAAKAGSEGGKKSRRKDHGPGADAHPRPQADFDHRRIF